MADGILCVNCGYQESEHIDRWLLGDDGDKPCGQFDSGYVRPTGPPKDACECYPNCPDDTAVVSSGGEYDEDTNSYSCSIRTVEVTGPCAGECRKKARERELNTPLNHSVMLVTRHGIIDIGG